METGLVQHGGHHAVPCMPSLYHAQAFLTALDEESDAWTFQTFADDGSGSPKLRRLLHGSLNDHADELVSLNERGAGVFVTVNETNGRGRKKPDITRIRALFVDLDGAPLEPVLTASPHIVVESSPGRFHAYWRVNDCPVDECEPALKALIHRFNGDPACCDRSRVLRLPGFFHRKAAPFLVRVIENNPGECRLPDLVGDLQKNQKMTADSSVTSVSSVGSVISRYIPDSPGQRNHCLFKLARHVKGLMPEATKDQLRAIVEQWYRLAQPNLGTPEFQASWGDFSRGWDAVKVPYGSVLNNIVDQIDMNEPMPPSLARLGYQSKGCLLVRICKQLQRNAGDGPFFLSARQAGELIGVHFTDASSYLAAMCADGVLQLVKRGSGKHASRYRYIWPE